jgi:hypothetical protein
MTEPPTDPNLGISRRVLLQRGAILGAGLVWSVPLVQSVQVAAFAGTPAPRFHGISYIGIVFTCGDVTYRAKFESEPLPGRWVDMTGLGASQWQGLPHCAPPAGWSSDSTVGLSSAFVPEAGASIDAEVQVVDGEVWRVTLTLPDGCAFSGDAGVTMGGRVCVNGVVGPSNVAVFTAPAASAA